MEREPVLGLVVNMFQLQALLSSRQPLGSNGLGAQPAAASFTINAVAVSYWHVELHCKA